ncbi:hypothetical protein [Mycobacterium dioxanotrophicus]|jgi:hypothetical protein|uniref:hypothetical protein n=1 Tax=Mycobacterium dioxanotrophicus TaxID=482462 RepID=UPI0012F8713D|nr:hypothetical protein [Mycobacterium dioxanotrophicus]
MALLPAARQTIYRLVKPKYGSLGPLQRPAPGLAAERARWNRFDLPGERTVYGASTPEGAYAELLGGLKRPPAMLASDLFDDVGDGETVEQLIADDWAGEGKRLAPYVIDLDWLYEYRMYTMLLPDRGWLVDAEHSSTVTYLHENMPQALCERYQRSETPVTVSDLRSEDRLVTTALAELMAGPVLSDGDPAIGLRFGSKHGSDWVCWAVWLRGQVEAGMVVDAGQPVAHPDENPVLAKVLETYHLSAQ